MQSLPPARDVHLYGHIGAADVDILPHWLSYYRGLGVRRTHLILHGRSDAERGNLRSSLAHDESVTIEEEFDGPFSEAEKVARLTSAVQRRRGEWVLLADADEFLELPYISLARTINALRLLGADSLHSVLVQRLARDGSLSALGPEDEPSTVFPLASVMLAEHMGTSPAKSKFPLFFVGENTVVRSGHHHPPSEQPTNHQPVQGVVHHFKWRAPLLETLAVRSDNDDANGPEMRAYLTWLNRNEFKLPLNGAFLSDRETLKSTGLLRTPDRRQLRQRVFINCLRHGRGNKLKGTERQLVAAETEQLQQAWGARAPSTSAKSFQPKAKHLAGRKGRFAFVTASLAEPHSSDGIGTAVAAIATLLAAAGHEVTIAFVPMLGQAQGIDPWWTDLWKARGIRLTTWPWPDEWPTEFDLFAWPRPDLYNWLEEQDFDVIHFNDVLALGNSFTAAKKCGLGFQNPTLVITAHGPALWHHIGNGLPVSPRQMSIIHDEKAALERADCVNAPSSYMLGWLDRHGVVLPAKSQVLPLPLRGEARIPVRWQRHFAVRDFAFFGRLEPRKGLDIFCDAIDQLSNDGHSFSVTFLGRPGEMPDGESVADYIGDRAKNWVVKWKIISDLGPMDALRYLQQEGLAAIIPSHCDNYPNTVLECVGAGIPFLTTNVGGIPEMVREEDRQIVLVPDTADDLAEGLRRFLSAGTDTVRPVITPEEVELMWLAWHGEMVAEIDLATNSADVVVSALVHQRAGEIAVCVPADWRHRGLDNTIGTFKHQAGEAFELLTNEDGHEAGKTEDAPAGTTELRRVKLEGRHWAKLANGLANSTDAKYLIFVRAPLWATPYLVRAFGAAMRRTNADAAICAFGLASAPTDTEDQPSRGATVSVIRVFGTDGSLI